MRNQSEALARPIHPMTESELQNVMSGLEDGHHVVVWYKHVKDFRVSRGEFSIDDTYLCPEEVVYVVKNKPLVATVESAYEIGERDEGEPPEGHFTDMDSGDDISYEGNLTSTYWSIEVRSDIEGHVTDVEVAGYAFTFNLLSHSATLCGDEVSSSELEALHEKLGEFLAQTA